MTDVGLLDGVERRLSGLSGWPRRGAAFALGLLAALAFAPIYAFPLFVVGLTGLVWLVDARRPALASFSAGWWWGFGHFIVCFYWVAESMLVDPARFGWMIPFSVGGLAGYMALYIALVALIARRLGLSGPAKVIAFAVLWTAGEWLRGHLLSGFPWDLAGYSLAFFDPLLQYAAFGGIWGLSLIVVAVAGMPATLAGCPRRLGSWSCLAAAAAAGLLAAGGAARLAAATPALVPGITLRIVQPAIPERAEWQPGDGERDVALERGLTVDVPGWSRISAAVWPESAVPFLLERDQRLRRWLGAAVPAKALLLTGAIRGEPLQGALARIYNSLMVLDHDGNLIASYDKSHLVPFGEYVPLHDWLPFLSKITPGGMDFTPGPGPRTLDLPGLPPVAPLICYEVIFPGRIVDPATRPRWLLNVTNDGWFGTSNGPYQHFVAARLRAVEEGLPLVRAANTGISGLIDPFGRVLAEIPLGRSGVKDVPLPVSLAPTPYARWGDWMLVVQLLVGGVLAALLPGRRRYITRN